ncbi:MAG: hypothetical protein LBH44_12240 [Treponema sp.]|jgi:hypothetical protein|nr:hypothetical protein [Treponema sp.]
MKKICSFLAVFVMLSAVFACTLPGNVQIKGTPEVTYPSKSDLIEMFGLGEDLVSGEGMISEKSNAETLTYLIHIELFNEVIKIDKIDGNSTSHGTNQLKMTADTELSKDKNECSIDLAELFDTLEGFEFEKVMSRLYLSCSETDMTLDIELKFDAKLTSEIIKDIEPNESIVNRNNWKNWKALPVDGEEIDLTEQMNSNGNITFNYYAYIPENKVISENFIVSEQSIMAELIIWLEMKFIAKEDPSNVKFPEDMFGTSDLFGRKSGEDSMSDMVRELEFRMVLNKNPFTGRTLYVEDKKKSDELKFQNPIAGNSLSFMFNEAAMKKINKPENIPFIPKIRIQYEKGKILRIPQDFKVTEMYFKAKIDYTQEF